MEDVGDNLIGVGRAIFKVVIFFSVLFEHGSTCDVFALSDVTTQKVWLETRK